MLELEHSLLFVGNHITVQQHNKDCISIFFFAINTTMTLISTKEHNDNAHLRSETVNPFSTMWSHFFPHRNVNALSGSNNHH